MLIVFIIIFVALYELITVIYYESLKIRLVKVGTFIDHLNTYSGFDMAELSGRREQSFGSTVFHQQLFVKRKGKFSRICPYGCGFVPLPFHTLGKGQRSYAGKNSSMLKRSHWFVILVAGTAWLPVGTERPCRDAVPAAVGRPVFWAADERISGKDDIYEISRQRFSSLYRWFSYRCGPRQAGGRGPWRGGGNRLCPGGRHPDECLSLIHI